MTWLLIVLSAFIIAVGPSVISNKEKPMTSTNADIQKQVDEVASLRSQVEERAKLIEGLNQQIQALRLLLEKNDRRIAGLQASTLTPESSHKRVVEAVKTDDGLHKESKRVLGDLGITSIKINN